MEICDVCLVTGRLLRVCTEDDDLAELLRHGAAPADPYHRVKDRPMPTMRAKLQVAFVQIHEQRLDADGRWDPTAPPAKTMETLQMHAVCAPKYDATGLDEDNTFAKFSPGATLNINVANPALWGKFAVGDQFYVDFTPVPKPAA